MSREQAATCPLGQGQVVLLNLQRVLPERGLADLIERSLRVGDPVRLSAFHFAACAPCAHEALVGEGQLCDRGRGLVDGARGWRSRP